MSHEKKLRQTVIILKVQELVSLRGAPQDQKLLEPGRMDCQLQKKLVAEGKPVELETTFFWF